MTTIDMYQKQYPHLSLSLEQLLTFIAYEGFLRRMSDCYEPFMLKGSFVSHTYFPNSDYRIAKDLDFVYFGTIKDAEKPSKYLPSGQIILYRRRKFRPYNNKSFKPYQ